MLLKNQRKTELLAVPFGHVNAVGRIIFGFVLGIAPGLARAPYNFISAGVGSAAVTMMNGMPRLLINGEPVPPLIFRSETELADRLAPLAPQVQLAAAHGVHIFAFQLLIPWTGTDYSYFDNAMNLFIQADPSAVFLLTIKMLVYDQANSLTFTPDDDNIYLDGSHEPISMGSDAYFNAYRTAVLNLKISLRCPKS